MNLYIHILISIITFFTIIPKFSSHSSHPTTIYDALTTNGLPIGILPKGITNFTLDPTTNKFTVTLNKTCNTKSETSVRFDWNFSGVLSYGQVSNLSGIAAQDLFLWFPVKGIHVDVPTSGLIYFDVGVVFKQFALSSFEVPKDCNEFGDGFGVDLVVLNVKQKVENLMGYQMRSLEFPGWRNRESIPVYTPDDTCNSKELKFGYIERTEVKIL